MVIFEIWLLKIFYEMKNVSSMERGPKQAAFYTTNIHIGKLIFLVSLKLLKVFQLIDQMLKS